jgi:hypothetical protein
VPAKPRRSRRRGAAAVEWIIVVIFIAITGLKLVLDFGRLTKCKMASGDNSSQCSGSGDVKLTPSDDGCIGLVCKKP